MKMASGRNFSLPFYSVSLMLYCKVSVHDRKSFCGLLRAASDIPPKAEKKTDMMAAICDTVNLVAEV